MSAVERRQTIVNRLKPCGCGCKGRDPQHRAEYKRTVTDIVQLSGAVAMTKSQPAMGMQAIAATGRARLPGYPRPVRVVRVIVLGHTLPYWEIDDVDATNARSGW